MAGAQTTAVEAVRLEKDDAYYALDEERLEQLQLALAAALRPDPLASSPDNPPPTELPPVLAIGAPAEVKVDEHDDAPLLLAKRVTGMRRWTISADANDWALATDLATGTTKWTRLKVSHKRTRPPTPSKSGPAPDAIGARSVSVSMVRHLVLRSALNEEWIPGRYALAVVEYDWISNTVVVKVEGQPADAAAGASHTRALSEHVQVDAAPLPLVAPGAALAVPSEVAHGAPIPVRGAVRLPGARAPLASPGVIVVTVLLLGLDANEPLAVELAVPAKGGRDEIEAAFTVDLALALPEHPPAGSYQVYLVAGDVIAGPHALRVKAP